MARGHSGAPSGDPNPAASRDATRAIRRPSIGRLTEVTADPWQAGVEPSGCYDAAVLRRLSARVWA